MANTSCTVTVLTDIPVEAISALHRALLDALGFEIVDSAPGCHYIYGDEYMDEFEEEMLEEVDVTREEIEKEFDHFPIHWTDIMRSVLKHPSMANTKHIDAMGGYQCSRPRKGEFGGFSIRMDRDGVRSFGTTQLLQQWDKEDVAASEGAAPKRFTVRVMLKDVRGTSFHNLTVDAENAEGAVVELESLLNSDASIVTVL